MKITYYGSACAMIEHEGVRVLCDPWFTPGAYYGSWFLPPDVKEPGEEAKDVDYVYISHVHPDHFDPGYLSRLSKNTPIIICEYEEKYLHRQLERLGFTHIIELPNQTSMRLTDDFYIEMYAADDVQPEVFSLSYGCKALEGYRRTLQIDSLVVFRGGGRVVVNLNDVPAAMAQVAAQYIVHKYRHVDAVLISHSGAGPFPQAYDFKREEMPSLALDAAMRYLSGTTLELLRLLKPDVYIPFAGGYILGGRNAWMNAFKGVSELDDLGKDLAVLVSRIGLQSEMLILESHGTYDVSRGRAVGIFKGTDFVARDKYIQSLASKKFDFEDDPEPGDLLPLCLEAQKTLLAKQKRYDYYSHRKLYVDTGKQVFRIPFDGSELQDGNKISRAADEPVTYAKIDPRLFKRILERKANWNNAEVGSHAILKPIVPPGVQSIEPMVHHLMAYFQGAPK